MGERDWAGLADGDLVALARAGRPGAYAAIVTRHKAALYRLILAHVRDADEALDLVQESFVSAHDALARFDPARSLRAWLSGIALNKCRDWARRRRVRAMLSRVLPVAAAEAVADDRVGTEAAAIERDSLAHTLAALDSLPEGLRSPLILCAIEGLSQAEAAEALGLSVKAIELRIRRARAALREKTG
ncbi:RNA polymerase sigma factor [Sphingomonas sanguinis]|uniref:RNA polymerase sigma factor n=1 Tax=Sphingomonas sanguinis TaxID=33051 RepID=A0A7Y7USY7_9SPHN|nr:RNA polymerase sigma factor [Sphingomonas sanguinis]MBZ6383556.1 RNA polymerase sigma factor [Sphingomonas sanguinis]NNG50518.1 RNA polymerase sigma factor [Sphingomonas sanguinis]NNG55057.1 RNA polymerase sigma factor [Sphingomonas sanguinis]NVP32850.1 RNA polymerase sigma factor [Sphingomonas sanguinis]